MVESCVDLAV